MAEALTNQAYEYLYRKIAEDGFSYGILQWQTR